MKLSLVRRFPAVVVQAVSALALAAVLAAGLRAQSAAGPAPAPKTEDRGAVLVELFTSEGCPHCPEADAMLEKMYTEQSVDGARIIALEEHVDYWDRPAWVDRFSSSAFTARQQGYADAMDLESLYTPQMVVDGLVEFVGNNSSRARAAISALARAPLPEVGILPASPGAAKTAPSSLLVHLEAKGLTRDSLADVYLVVAEDKLLSRVGGGSNSGESWPHSSVARSFHLVGKLPPGRGDLSITAPVVSPGSDWRLANLRLIAFVQEEESRRVIALGAAPLAGLLPQSARESRPAAGFAGRGLPRAVSKTSRGSSN